MDALDRWYTSHYRRPGDRLIRVERQPHYEDNAAMLARWEAGDTTPDYHSPWCQTLSMNASEGLIEERVRIFTADLTPDERAAIVLGYPATSRHYRRMVVYRDGEHRVPHLPVDFYVAVDGITGAVSAAILHYSASGVYEDVTVIDDPSDPGEARGFLVAVEAALRGGEPFSGWYARHANELIPRKVA